MNRNDIDWKVIRGSLVAIAVSLSVSASLVTGSFYFRDAMQKEFSRNDALFRNISNRYLAIDEEEKQINKYYPEFLVLFEKGVIGQEQRLNWIEVLRQTGADINLPSLVYSISSQRPYSPAFNVTTGKFQIHASEMSLQLSLGHEGDLFNLLDGMNARVNGAFTVNDCSFRRSGTTILVNKPDAINLLVNCQIDWYTIKLSDGSEIKVET